MTFGSNVEVSFDAEKGIQIMIHDNMGRTVAVMNFNNIHKLVSTMIH